MPMSHQGDADRGLTRDERVAMLGEGPWIEEPDRVEWRAHGLPCLLVRAMYSGGGGGQWCGYVGVPPGHPWHGRALDDEVGHDIDVHGGVTYAAPCQGAVCHVPAPGEPDDVWWLGFDAAHAFDLQPGTRKLLADLDMPADLRRGDTYRDVAYMRAECERLAEQAVRAAGR
jgi:hypothetical protein